ncbi:MAG TPA: hypothetical protein VMA32_16265 [Streptosporangiaceae bacterium]|nr:hypothetical protein [Streptosporangiaceae bacterium]
MTTAYLASDWAGFGAAVATAAAALAGLLFVAISINLQKILDYPSLPTRAAQTLIYFVTPLIAALLIITPGQGRIALAVELIATALTIGGAQLYLDVRTERGAEDTLYRRLIAVLIPVPLSCGSLLIAGATLAAQAGGGLYWLVPSVLSAIIFGLTNVWVLLVEIQR